MHLETTESIPEFTISNHYAKRSLDIVTLGSLVMEEIVQIDRWPDYGGQDVVNVKSIHTTSGGCAMNVSCFAARFGAEAAIISTIGDGKYSLLPMKELKRSGVHTDFLSIHCDKDGNLIIILTDHRGDWAVLEYLDPDLRLQENDIPTKDTMSKTKILHIDGFSYLNAGEKSAVNKAIKISRDAGCILSVDASVYAAKTEREFLESLFYKADIVFANHYEALTVVGTSDLNEAINEFREMGPKVAIIKMGKDGSYIITGDAVGYIPAYEVDVIDTVAAGDAYIASTLYSLCKGKPLMEAVERGSAAGALACLGVGSLSNYFRNAEIDKLISRGYQKR